MKPVSMGGQKQELRVRRSGEHDQLLRFRSALILVADRLEPQSPGTVAILVRDDEQLTPA